MDKGSIRILTTYPALPLLGGVFGLLGDLGAVGFVISRAGTALGGSPPVAQFLLLALFQPIRRFSAVGDGRLAALRGLLNLKM